ncbi:hypothetical protein C1H46_013203 [Malus baccata]|uniref:Uncharacterized protein n=1 Tax=Malus baccata TaxID=106549 RepID=A0A540MS39_MALBA|nr:hypothetical protein C1H46_013203 [Malus baccata]
MHNDGASTNVSDDGTTDMVPNSLGFNSDQWKNDKSVPEVYSSGPPPGFEHRNETNVGMILLNPMVEDEVRRVSSWYDMAQSDLGVAPVDVTVNIDAMLGMTLVLFKSQKRRMRKKTRDGDLRPEPIETRARSALLRPSS